MNTAKRLLSAVLCLILLISSVPFTLTANADFAITVYDWDALYDNLAKEAYGEIKLGKDITFERSRGGKTASGKIYESEYFILVNGKKTLDLNGYSITVQDNSNVEDGKDDDCISDSHIFYLSKNTKADLTVKDSKGGGQISNNGYYICPAVMGFDDSIYGNLNQRSIFYVADDAALTIDGGTYIAGGAKKQYLSDEVCNAHLILSGFIVECGYKSRVVIKDGDFTAYALNRFYDGYRGGIFDTESSSLIEIYGGNFLVKGEGPMFTFGCEAKIYNGTFLSETYGKIRRLGPHSFDNAASSGVIQSYNIRDSYWKREGTTAYIDGVEVTAPAEGQFDFYKDSKPVSFSTKVLGGTFKLGQSSAYVGDTINLAMSGHLGLIYKNSRDTMSFRWQRSQAYEYEPFVDIEGANGVTYKPTKDDYGLKIRCVVSVKGYPNEFVSNFAEVTKKQNDKTPVKPVIHVDYANSKVIIRDIANYPEQEFVICEDSLDYSWPNFYKMSPDENGEIKDLKQNKTYYLYIRYKETETHFAGNNIFKIPISLSQTVYLSGIDLFAESESAEYNEYIKITAEPVPSNVTSFSGISGSRWYINSSKGAKLYADTKGTPLDTSKSYTEVYLKGGDAAEIAEVSAEYTVSYNDVKRGTTKVNVQGKDGTYAFGSTEISFEPADGLIIERGSSAIMTLKNKEYPGKPIKTVSVKHSSGDSLSGIGFERISGTDDMLVTLSEGGNFGKGYYKLVINGTEMTNSYAVTAVEQLIPVESVKINKTGIISGIGEKKELIATVFPSNATENTALWSSSDSTVVTVSDGVVTAHKAGSAVITAKAGGKSATCTVNVTDRIKKYKVDIEFGTADAEFASKDTKVTVKADTPAEGYVFDKWISEEVTFADENAADTSFTMPSGGVSVTATFKAVPYAVTVTNGTASAAQATIGTAVTLTANADNFCKWEVTGATVENEKALSTSFTMGASAVTAKALTHKDDDKDYKCDYGCGKEFPKPAEPTTQPTTQAPAVTEPTTQPTTQAPAVTEPTTQPTTQPTTKPSEEPTTKPSEEPTTKPSTPEVHKHTEIIIPAVEATYTKTGLTEGKKCSSCDEILVSQKTVARKKLKKVSSLKKTAVTLAKGTKSTVTISWKKVTGAQKYEVYRYVKKKWKKIKTTSKTSYKVTKLKSNTSYKFKVRAVAGTNKGSFSSVLTAKTVPLTTTLTVKAGKKRLTASWKKVANITGYEVQYSTSKKFTKKTTKTSKITKAKTVKKTIKSLKKGKKYYVRVRAYKTVNGKKVYSPWSAVKSVKVK